MGSFLAMAVKSSLTFSLVLADVSKKSSPASRAYCSASAVEMARLSGDSVTRSSLFPASAMMMFSLAWRCSSLTHAFALSSDACPTSVATPSWRRRPHNTYRLCDVVDDYGAVCIAVVHGGKRLVALLACRIPDLKLDRCVLIQGDGLGKEGGANRRLPVIIELVLPWSAWRAWCRGQPCVLTLTKRNTRDDWGQVSSDTLVMAGMAGWRTFPTADSPATLSVRVRRTKRRPYVPSSTSLNCANLEPPGRWPCCILPADMLASDAALSGYACTGGRGDGNKGRAGGRTCWGCQVGKRRQAEEEGRGDECSRGRGCVGSGGSGGGGGGGDGGEGERGGCCCCCDEVPASGCQVLGLSARVGSRDPGAAVAAMTKRWPPCRQNQNGQSVENT